MNPTESKLIGACVGIEDALDDYTTGESIAACGLVLLVQLDELCKDMQEQNICIHESIHNAHKSVDEMLKTLIPVLPLCSPANATKDETTISH